MRKVEYFSSRQCHPYWTEHPCVFMATLSRASPKEAFFLYGIVPCDILIRNSLDNLQPSTMASVPDLYVSSWGFLHILGNMWFLYIFETILRTGLAYSLSHLLPSLRVAAGLVHLVTNWNSNVQRSGRAAQFRRHGAYLLFILGPE